MLSSQKMKTKRFNLREPCLTKGLSKSVKNKSRLLYKLYKNKLTHSFRVAKRLHYEKGIDQLKSNMKGKQLFNEIL